MMISDFESKIQKDSSKSMASCSGIHSLTVETMNFLSLLADYSNVPSDIFADWPPPPKSSMPESVLYSSNSDDSLAPSFSLKTAWIILVLLCKLDGKLVYYKDVSLSYLFLANNLRHLITKVQTSNLQFLLGDEWIAKHESKMRRFMESYQKLVWGKVLSSLLENPKVGFSSEEAKMIFRNFNFKFEEAIRRQSSFIVPNPET